jgi:predicted nucleic acid-binding protein
MDLAALTAALAAHRTIFVDTMVFVYLLDNHPVYANTAAAVLGAIERGAPAGVTSMLTLAELLTGPARAGNLTALRDYELYLTNFPHLHLHPFDASVARRVALVRAATSLRTPDAIQLATATVAGATAIVGNDKAWQGKTGALALLLLDDYLS